MATNTLHIRVRSDGTRVVSKEIKSIGESANLASRQIFLMRRAITTLFAAAGIRAGFRMIEQFTELNNKLKTVTSSTEELIRVRTRLLQISNASRTALSANVQLYARTTRAIESLGISEENRLKFTELLAKEAVIGGATTVEATNAIRQLTQGMGAAGLKGEELRSVLEQLPTVAKRIADFLGVSTGELRKLGEEGKLTGEVVVAAMLAAENAIQQAFGETTATVGGSFEVLKNSFIEFTGNIDQFTGGSKTLAASLQLVARNLEIISALVLGLAARAVFVALANNGLTLAAAIGIATGKVFTFVKSLFVVGTAVPVVRSATAAFLQMTAAASVSSAAALPTVAALSLPVMFGLIAAVTALTLGFTYLSSKQNKYVTEVEAATRAEKAHEEAIRKKMQAMQWTFGGGPETSGDLLKEVEKRNKDPMERLKSQLPEVERDLRKIQALYMSIGTEELNIAFNRDNPLKAESVERSRQKVVQLNKEITDLKESIKKVDIASTKDFSVAKVLAEAEAAAKGLGGQLQFAEQAARGLMNLMDRGNGRPLFSLTEDELKGTSAQQKANEIQSIVSRMKELRTEWDENALSSEKFQQAMQVNRERLDELTGGASAATQQLAQENALFEQYGGDMEVIAMKIAGATDAKIAAFIKEKNIQQELKDARDANLASQRQEEAVRRQNTAAINGTIDALKEELRLFGLVGRARQLAQFEALPGVSETDVNQFKQLQNQLGQRETEAAAQAAVTQLQARIEAFAKQSEELKKIAASAPPKVAEDIANLLKEGQAKIDLAAQTLAEKLATEVGASASTMVAEAERVLVAGGTTVGAAVGGAFASAFKAALAGAIPGISALNVPGGGFPVAPGDPSGAGGLTAEQLAQQEASTQTLQRLGSEIDSNTERMRALTEQFNLFGFQAETSSGRASNALSGFGDQATNLGQELQGTFNSIFSSLEDALVGFVTTGKLDFKSLINSILADLARMVVRMLIIQPLMGFFSGFFGGIFGFSGGGSVGGAFGLPGFASGGFVNDDPSVPQRFATGGRVYGPGTGVSDSVNALLSRDEFVVNAAASRRNMAGLEYLNETGRMPGGGSVTSVTYSPNVNVTVEGNSDRAAGNGAQIARDMEQQMRAQFNEFVAQEQRPGGAFSKTNEDVL